MAEDTGPSRGRSPPAIVSTLRRLIGDELRGIYTVSMVIVESVDETNRRAEVLLKSDRDVLVDNVPIASPFARDGAGMIVPVSRGDEGLLLHAREPLERRIVRRGHETPRGERRFTLEDGVFLPMLWLDEDDVPEHEDGEFQIALPGDGSVFRLLPDGRAALEHSSGTEISISPEGDITLGDPSSSEPVLTEDAVLEDADGNEVTIVDPGSEDVDAS